MSTPTDFSSPDATSAIVLTHPAFDRPPVHNERRRGRKKGTHSLADARRARWQRELSPSGRVSPNYAQGMAEGYAAADRALRSEFESPNELGTPAAPAAPEASLPWQSRAINMPPRDPLAPPRQRHEDAVIGAALAIIEERMRAPAAVLEQPQAVKDYLRMHLAGLDREAFGVMFFDVRQRLIAFEVLFEGTLTHAAVHPREVARRALQLNAACVVLAHNHPSGVAEASRSDELLTSLLRQALGLFDVRVLDHVIVAGNGAMSFAERGLL